MTVVYYIYHYITHTLKKEKPQNLIMNIPYLL